MILMKVEKKNTPRVKYPRRAHNSRLPSRRCALRCRRSARSKGAEKHAQAEARQFVHSGAPSWPSHVWRSGCDVSATIRPSGTAPLPPRSISSSYIDVSSSLLLTLLVEEVVRRTGGQAATCTLRADSAFRVAFRASRAPRWRAARPARRCLFRRERSPAEVARSPRPRASGC